MCKKKGITNRKSKDRFLMGFTSFLDRQMKFHFIGGPKEKKSKTGESPQKSIFGFSNWYPLYINGI